MARKKERGLEAFVEACRGGERTEADLGRLFEGLVCLPLESEHLLQAYLYFHRALFCPAGCEVLLYEQALLGEATDLGKCDFVLLDDHRRLLLVETKYIPTEDKGRAARRRRNGQRRKLRQQVHRWRQVLLDGWGLDPADIRMAVFTTDPKITATIGHEVEAAHVEIHQLQSWRSELRASIHRRRPGAGEGPLADHLPMDDRFRQLHRLESIGRLSAGVAHDFNNLLTPIIGYAELLLMGMDPWDTRRDELQRIVRAARFGKEHTRQLLSFSRRWVSHSRPMDVAAVVEASLPALRWLVGDAIEIHAELDTPCGPVLIDRSQLQQVLTDLLLNARDAMPHGGEIRLTLRNHSGQGVVGSGAVQGPQVVLTVSDSGHGMRPEVLERVFEPFFTTRAADGVAAGVGVGLSTARRVIQRHRGSIHIESREAEGTTVHVRLPCSEVTEVAGTQPFFGQPTESAGATVLVVEDDEDVRRLCVQVLSRSGYHVLQAANGESALRLVEPRALAVQLLLTDVVLPGMNGKQLFERISALMPGLPVLFMSGYPDDVLDRHDVTERGLDLLAKPFEVRELVRAVARALAGAATGGAR